MGVLHVEFGAQRIAIDNVDDTDSLREFLERVRAASGIEPSHFYKYRLLAWRAAEFPPDIKNLVDPARAVGYVRAEFMIPWNAVLYLDRVLE